VSDSIQFRNASFFSWDGRQPEAHNFLDLSLVITHPNYLFNRYWQREKHAEEYSISSTVHNVKNIKLNNTLTSSMFHISQTLGCHDIIITYRILWGRKLNISWHRDKSSNVHLTTFNIFKETKHFLCATGELLCLQLRQTYF
jgi:hypothetical protein